MFHRGYVYSSAFCSQDEAVAELRSKNPGMSDPWFVKFRSGRHEHFWHGNVAALGNAYAFVEPLESTALHMIIIQVTRLLRLLDANRRGTSDQDPAEVNRRVAAHWDYLRWFLALHYRFNGRLDTPFWRHCRQQVDIRGLADTVADFQQNGPFSGRSYQRPLDAIFGAGGLDILLLGQDVPTAGGRPNMDRAAWSALRSKREEHLQAALSHREALQVLREQPELLDDILVGEDSWCVELGHAIAD
jgi:tryptophan halogenase